MARPPDATAAGASSSTAPRRRRRDVVDGARDVRARGRRAEAPPRADREQVRRQHVRDDARQVARALSRASPPVAVARRSSDRFRAWPSASRARSAASGAPPAVARTGARSARRTARRRRSTRGHAARVVQRAEQRVEELAGRGVVELQAPPRFAPQQARRRGHDLAEVLGRVGAAASANANPTVSLRPPVGAVAVAAAKASPDAPRLSVARLRGARQSDLAAAPARGFRGRPAHAHAASHARSASAPSGSAATSAAASDPVLSTVVSPAPASAAAKNAYVSGSSVEAHELVASSNLVVMASPASGATRRTPAVGGARGAPSRRPRRRRRRRPTSRAAKRVRRARHEGARPDHERLHRRGAVDDGVAATLAAATSARPAPSTKLPAAVHS